MSIQAIEKIAKIAENEGYQNKGYHEQPIVDPTAAVEVPDQVFTTLVGGFRKFHVIDFL